MKIQKKKYFFLGGGSGRGGGGGGGGVGSQGGCEQGSEVFWGRGGWVWGIGGGQGRCNREVKFL